MATSHQQIYGPQSSSSLYCYEHPSPFSRSFGGEEEEEEGEESSRNPKILIQKPNSNSSSNKPALKRPYYAGSGGRRHEQRDLGEKERRSSCIVRLTKVSAFILRVEKGGLFDERQRLWKHKVLEDVSF